MDWNYLFIINPNITPDIIEAHSDKPRHWYLLSKNPNITWDISSLLDKFIWDWNYLSEHGKWTLRYYTIQII